MYSYVFNYTDHLGNIRLRYTKDPNNSGALAILEEDHYYPYGLKHKGYNGEHKVFEIGGAPGSIVLTPVTPFFGDSYKYKFGGKEYSDDLGLNSYDFGARNYDPALGRWMNLDPLAEQMRRHSPYNYAFDNPIYFIDPDGMMPMASIAPPDFYIDSNTGKLLGQDGAATNNIRSIDSQAFNSISEANGGTTSAEATSQLQENSTEVAVNQDQIDSDLATINNETVADQSAERQMYITLSNTRDADGNWTQEVTSEMGEVGTDGHAPFTTSPPNSDGVRMRSGNIVLGGAHTHNLTSQSGAVNIPGTSGDDVSVAKGFGVTIYSVDSYTGQTSTSTSGPAVHRVTSNGVQTNNVGTTNNNNIGLDALKIFSGIK